MAWIAAAVVILDRVTKLAARSWGTRDLIPGAVRITYAENTGMAFSLLSGKGWLLGLVSLAIIAAGILLLGHMKLDRLGRCAAMLMLGGALGNLADRLFQGYVVDMIELTFVRFAVFNVADMALTCGAALMAISLLRPGKPPEEKEDGHDRGKRA